VSVFVRGVCGKARLQMSHPSNTPTTVYCLTPATLAALPHAPRSCSNLQACLVGVVALGVGSNMNFTTPTVSVIFTCGLLLVDAIYRLPLALNGVSIPCTMQAPWKATTLRDFWAERWNLVIQRMLKEGVYLPLRRQGWARHAAATSTFFASGLLHAYPLMLLGMETRHAVQMLGFFLLQPALMALENAMNIKARFHSSLWGRVWVVLVMLITLPLFTYPVMRVLKARALPQKAY
jgi:hypothetical protein